MVEQRIENPRVGGSNPPPGTIQSSQTSLGRAASEFLRDFRGLTVIDPIFPSAIATIALRFSPFRRGVSGTYSRQPKVWNCWLAVCFVDLLTTLTPKNSASIVQSQVPVSWAVTTRVEYRRKMQRVCVTPDRVTPPTSFPMSAVSCPRWTWSLRGPEAPAVPSRSWGGLWSGSIWRW